MSRAVYYSLRWKGEKDPPPTSYLKIDAGDIMRGQNALTRWNLAERFGWTLEYIDSLSAADLFELIQVDDGRQRAERELHPPPDNKGRR